MGEQQMITAVQADPDHALARPDQFLAGEQATKAVDTEIGDAD
jgi:hypothetical protein